MIWIVKVARWLSVRWLAGICGSRKTRTVMTAMIVMVMMTMMTKCMETHVKLCMYEPNECRLYTVSNSLFAWIIKSKHRHQHHFSGEVVFSCHLCLYACVRASATCAKTAPVFMHRKFNKIQRKIATTERGRKKREHKIKETTEQKRKNNKIKSNRRKWVEETTRMPCYTICYVAFVHDSNDVFICVVFFSVVIVVFVVVVVVVQSRRFSLAY